MFHTANEMYTCMVEDESPKWGQVDTGITHYDDGYTGLLDYCA